MQNRTTRARRAAARRVLRDRQRAQRAAARIRRRSCGSLTTYALAAGLKPRDAQSMVGTLRKVADRIQAPHIPVRVHRAGRMRDTRRFTPDTVAVICRAYRPRRDLFKRAALVLAGGAA